MLSDKKLEKLKRVVSSDPDSFPAIPEIDIRPIKDAEEYISDVNSFIGRLYDAQYIQGKDAGDPNKQFNLGPDFCEELQFFLVEGDSICNQL